MENNNTQVQGFEQIKQGLENAGFTQNGNTFTKETAKRQLVIVNGVQQTVEQRMDIRFIYLGEGYMENGDGSRTPLYGFTFSINNDNLTDFWVKDITELMSYFKH